MGFWLRITAASSNLLHKDKLESDLDAEIREYVDALAEEKIAAGMCFESIQAVLNTRYGVAFAMALTTGLRPSELLARRWSHVKWLEQTITVARTLEKETDAMVRQTNASKDNENGHGLRLRDWSALTRSRSGDPVLRPGGLDLSLIRAIRPDGNWLQTKAAMNMP